MARPRLGTRLWLSITVVAALVGAVTGAGTMLLTRGSGDQQAVVTIRQGDAPPGPAQLSGNAGIPAVVRAVVPAVVSVEVQGPADTEQGTGMFISPDGTILTNNHVVALVSQGQGGRITVTQSGSDVARPAVLLGADPSDDVALLKVAGSGFPTVTFGNSAKVAVGDAVVAIGNALALSAGTPTVTQGIISATGRAVRTSATPGGQPESLFNLFQTDAAINPGSSGGPLVDSAGQVIGMDTAVYGDASDGDAAQNVGFAIPSNTLEALVPDLVHGGVLAAGGGYLGLQAATVTPALARHFGFSATSGAVVISVYRDSPAGQFGLAQGEVIVAVDGTTVTSAAQLQDIVRHDRPGQEVQVTYLLGQSVHHVTVTLGSDSPVPAQQPPQLLPLS